MQIDIWQPQRIFAFFPLFFPLSSFFFSFLPSFLSLFSFLFLLVPRTAWWLRECNASRPRAQCFCDGSRKRSKRRRDGWNMDVEERGGKREEEGEKGRANWKIVDRERNVLERMNCLFFFLLFYNLFLSFFMVVIERFACFVYNIYVYRFNSSIVLDACRFFLFLFKFVRTLHPAFVHSDVSSITILWNNW